jgi:hypothetical protein
MGTPKTRCRVSKTTGYGGRIIAAFRLTEFILARHSIAECRSLFLARKSNLGTT